DLLEVRVNLPEALERALGSQMKRKSRRGGSARKIRGRHRCRPLKSGDEIWASMWRGTALWIGGRRCSRGRASRIGGLIGRAHVSSRPHRAGCPRGAHLTARGRGGVVHCVVRVLVMHWVMVVGSVVS